MRLQLVVEEHDLPVVPVQNAADDAAIARVGDRPVHRSALRQRLAKASVLEGYRPPDRVAIS